MSAAFTNNIISVTPAPPGFSVDVWHHETPPGGKQKNTEHHRFPVIAWAVVTRIDWSEGREVNCMEPIFLVSGHPTNSSQYQYTYSDLRPAPGEPKLTVGIHVNEPSSYVVVGPV